MSEGVKKFPSNGFQKTLSTEEQQAKINEVRRLVGKLPDKLSIYCSDASISRHLRARSWNVKKATKMLKETLKWRAEYRPEEIRWEEIAFEAETGKVYRSSYTDKHGRSVLVMRPGCENTKSTKGQIRYLVYCLENAILNLPPNQEEMVWLIDFHGFNLANISLKVTRETAHVLQDHYPERLGLAILYNPPKFFEPFWMAAKAFLDPKTHKKATFVYSDEPNTMKIMEDIFDIEQLEYAFGGKSNSGFDISKYAERMREDDTRMPYVWTRASIPSSVPPTDSTAASLDSLNLDSDSNASSGDKMDSSQPHGMDSETSFPGNNVPSAHTGRKESEGTDMCEDANPKDKAHA